MDVRNAFRTLVAVAALLAFPLAAPAADEPEAVFAKFHSASLTANFDEIRKYGTAENGDIPWWMPVWLNPPLKAAVQRSPATSRIITSRIIMSRVTMSHFTH